MPRIARSILVVLAGVVVERIAALPSYQHNNKTSETVSWQDCSGVYGSGFDCANFTVPLDWHDPRGEKINLGLNRYKTNSSSRIGSLFVNFGGPGGITTQGLVEALPAFNPDLLDRFDIVAMDPRGLGLSTPIQCDVGLWNERQSLYPQTEDEFEALLEYNRKLGESCLQLSGNIVRYMDTASVARDMEAVRKALGNEPLNYLGFSYGSQIGNQYASLFPHNIRAIVGDGITDHEQDEISALLTEVDTYENSFNRLAAWCNTTSDCALHGQDVSTLWDELVVKANNAPIPASGAGNTSRSDVNGEELRFNLQGGLTSVSARIGPGWAAVSEGIAAAIAGDATSFATELAQSNAVEANSALFGAYGVACLDWHRGAKDISQSLDRQLLTAMRAPHTQGASQTYSIQARCQGWPAPITNPPQQRTISTNATMLLVNALHDPETSYAWAVAAQKLVQNSVLLSRDGDGHTSYFLGGEAGDVINAYLINGTLPARGSVVYS